MKYFRRLYHFLGGVSFALFLIAAVAFFVIMGTFIESSTQSHQYAAKLAYGNPFFALLLWGFFINILFSAIRRWPFQVRHLPFLVTHLGLLMILAGSLSKHYLGIQGVLQITEGSGSHYLLTKETYALQVENRTEPTPIFYLLKRSFSGSLKPQLNLETAVQDSKVMQDSKDPINLPSSTAVSKLISPREAPLTFHLRGFVPHSKSRLIAWIKDNKVWMDGFPPLPVKDAENYPTTPIPLSGRKNLFPSEETPWEIYALKSKTPTTLIPKLYRQGTQVRLSRRVTGEELGFFSLEDLLDKPVQLSNLESIYLKLSLNFSSSAGFESPKIEGHLLDSNGSHPFVIPLSGDKALLNEDLSKPYLGKFPIAIDLVRPPTLVLLENAERDIHLLVFDAHGTVWQETFQGDRPNTLLAYDNGFQGYATQVTLPAVPYPTDRQMREAALLHRLAQDLKPAIVKGTELSPPLKLLQQACQKHCTDFVDTLLTFLSHWEKSHTWLYPIDYPLPKQLAQIFNSLDWTTVNQGEREGCKWTERLFIELAPLLQQEKSPLEILQTLKWPLIAALEAKQFAHGVHTDAHLLTLLTQQIFEATSQLPLSLQIEEEIPPERQATWLSAYLRAYEIHLSNILPTPDAQEMHTLLHEFAQIKHPSGTEIPKIVLESPILPSYQPLAPDSKLEERVPTILLEIWKDNQRQRIALSYDQSNSGLKWPIFNGSYLIRFQSAYTKIPYHIRLRQARQINYPNSNQPYSFESDVLITDRRTGKTFEKTLSMNHVHETADGYRFYLSSINPTGEGAVKRVQLVVNRDPAKYWLTYPGALILSLGILLLFWMRPYRYKRK